VPGSDERKLAKASSLHADTIVLDLEDGVAPDRKGAARDMVYDALEVRVSDAEGRASCAYRFNRASPPPLPSRLTIAR
jgi:citrate lyase subunit beta/citryl-CoA lyase